MCIQAFELRVSRKGRLLQTWILAVETLVASLPILAVVLSNLVPKTQQHKIKSENSHLTACEALLQLACKKSVHLVARTAGSKLIDHTFEKQASKIERRCRPRRTNP